MPPKITPEVALSLQQTAGNVAVARLLARDAAPAPAVDRAKLQAIEGRMTQVAQRAQGRSDRIGTASEAVPRVAGGVGAAAGELAEQRTGKAVDKGKDAGTVGAGEDKPSATAAGGGPPDKFAEAFGHLDRMIDMLPQFGASAKSQVAMAMGAQELAKDALRLAGGGQARFTAAEVDEKAAALSAEDAAATAAAEAIAVEQRIDAMALAIMRKAVREPREIERDLWRAWMASLKDPRVLANSDIKEYLGPKGFGLVDLGEWVTFPGETRDAVDRAQREWAEETTGARSTAPVPGASAPQPGPPPTAEP